MCFKNEDQVVYENSKRLWNAILINISTALDVTKSQINYCCIIKAFQLRAMGQNQITGSFDSNTLVTVFNWSY